MAGSPLGGFEAGSQIAGYVLEEQIGHGGMAVVFRAHDERLDRTVALKILTPALADDEAFRQRFIRESRAAAAVDDPHIIPVFEAGEASGVLFIAMRYVHGGDVGTAARHAGLLPIEEVAAIVSQVASALDAAHARGLVHRDVKPANMLLDAGSRSGRPDHVYLSDFGLSKPQVTAAKITATGQFLGTLDYVSPEQVAGEQATAASDQYSLACAAFELLSGAPPFERDTGMAMMYAHMHATPAPLTSRRPELPPAVDQVFARALAKAPVDRYGSCREFAEALRAALGLRSYRTESDAGPDQDQPAVSFPARVHREVAAAAMSPGAAATVGDSADDLPVTTTAVQVAGPPTESVQAGRTELALDEPGRTAAGTPPAQANSRGRWWRSRPVLAAAAAVVVLGGAGTALLLSGGGGSEPSGAVIFKSDFSSGAPGWQVTQDPTAGRIENGSYYIRAKTGGTGVVSVPTNASNVYPSAPPNIRIDVNARASEGPVKFVQYGLMCRRNNNNSYVFEIQGSRVTIGKLVQGGYSPLVSTNASIVHVGSANRLTAVCESVTGQQAVRLALAVNGTQLLAVTDRTSPLSGGTVGIFANFYGESIPNGVEAAFQSFQVEHL